MHYAFLIAATGLSLLASLGSAAPLAKGENHFPSNSTVRPSHWHHPRPTGEPISIRQLSVQTDAPDSVSQQPVRTDAPKPTSQQPFPTVAPPISRPPIHTIVPNPISHPPVRTEAPLSKGPSSIAAHHTATAVPNPIETAAPISAAPVSIVFHHTFTRAPPVQTPSVARGKPTQSGHGTATVHESAQPTPSA